MRPKFDNVATVENHDLVGLANGAELMSDDDDGATYREFEQA
jgi:hypothetical protein